VRVVSVRDVRVRYDGGAAVPLPAIEVASGERVAVTGRNGSGKSTLLRVFAGVLSAEGTVDRAGAASGTAWVAQRPFLFRGTAGENVGLALAGERIPRHERAERVRDALASVGAADLGDRDARSLSEGQAMRVAIARALVARPRLLLLDEALAPLDAEGARLAAEAILATPGLTVVAAAPSATALAALRPTRVVRL
jgi:ABC-type nitrate/sulfonate/bicarbonate transport system ATPase subunit